MRFFWVGHFEFFFQEKIFFCFISMKTSSLFLWGIIFFLHYGWFLQNLGKTSFQLICTRLYICVLTFFCISNLGMDHLLLEVPMILERIMRKRMKTTPMTLGTPGAGVQPCSELLRLVIWKTASIGQMVDQHLVAKKECLWNKAKQSCRLSIKPWWPELQPNDYEIDQKKSKNALL